MLALEQIRADIREARSRREAISDQLTKLLPFAGDEPLSTGQQERADNLQRGVEKASAEIATLEEELSSAFAESVRSGQVHIEQGNVRELRSETGSSNGDPTSASLDPRAQGIRSAALRANERASFLPTAAQEHMERQLRQDDDPEQRMGRLVSALADRDYFRAFAAWMRDPQAGGHEWTPAEREAVRTVRTLERALGLGSQGGAFLAPYELDPAITIANAGAVSPLRRIARVTTTAFNTKKFVTSVGVTSTWTTEGTEQTDDSPALLQPSIDAKKGMAWVPVSFELFEDSDIAQQVAAVLGDAKAVQEALGFTLTQTNGPIGIISAVSAVGGSVIATGTNAVAIADAYNNQQALPARWRPNAKFMANLTSSTRSGSSRRRQG
jgi:HK97 family phage major capsid protein